jgi:hypothetical protein
LKDLEAAREKALEIRRELPGRRVPRAQDFSGSTFEIQDMYGNQVRSRKGEVEGFKWLLWRFAALMIL